MFQPFFYRSHSKLKIFVTLLLTMKNYCLTISLLLTTVVFGQKGESSFTPRTTAKWAPAGLLVGGISLQGEYNIGRHSLTAKIGVPASRKYDIEYDGDEADYELRATSFMAGYRIYLSKKQMRGLYFEPFLKYVHHTADGVGRSTIGIRNVAMNFDNKYEGFGVGAQLGAQFFIGKRFIIDLFFLGPEINSANNKFRALESTNTIPWTIVEAQDAERDIREFIEQFPFIRNKTEVMVDRNNKTVIADFKGALPGFRAGISFGLAF